MALNIPKRRFLARAVKRALPSNDFAGRCDVFVGMRHGSKIPLLLPSISLLPLSAFSVCLTPSSLGYRSDGFQTESASEASSQGHAEGGGSESNDSEATAGEIIATSG